MKGGLGKALSFKNINGSCFLDCTLNSILNSYTMIKKLYKFAPSNTSLNWSYNKIIKSDNYNGISTMYLCLLSAYIHDYINNEKYIDKDKILNLISCNENDEIDDESSLKEVILILQTKYKNMDTVRISSFILNDINIAVVKNIRFFNCNGLYRTLRDRLSHYKDIYIVLLTASNEFQKTIDLNKKECKVIRSLFKAALTGTGVDIQILVMCSFYS